MTADAKSYVERSLITVGDAAALLHVHPNTVRRWEAQGLIRAWRIGPRRDRRFLRSEVEHLLEGQGQILLLGGDARG